MSVMIEQVSKARVEAFSDGVIAVAITLLDPGAELAALAVFFALPTTSSEGG